MRAPKKLGHNRGTSLWQFDENRSAMAYPLALPPRSRRRSSDLADPLRWHPYRQHRKAIRINGAEEFDSFGIAPRLLSPRCAPWWDRRSKGSAHNAIDLIDSNRGHATISNCYFRRSLSVASEGKGHTFESCRVRQQSQLFSRATCPLLTNRGNTRVAREAILRLLGFLGRITHLSWTSSAH